MEPRSHQYYIEKIYDELPQEAFQNSNDKRVYNIYGYLLFLLICLYICKIHPNIYVYLTIGIVSIILLPGLGFLAHEFSHGAVKMNNKRSKKVIEIISWATLFFSATLWRKVHNESHHKSVYTKDDPDRFFFLSEKSRLRDLYSFFTSPNKLFKWNPLVVFWFLSYIFRNLAAALYPGENKPAIVPFKPKFSKKAKNRILQELLLLALIHTAIIVFFGFNAYVFAFFIPIALSTWFTSFYAFTQHNFNQKYHDHLDPLLSTTSVIVPKWLNLIHYNFSYHTEHHLFPNMNSKYFPLVSNLLKEKFPDRYHTITMKKAFKEFWKWDLYVHDDDVINSNTVGYRPSSN